jgi:hypothetical protein
MRNVDPILLETIYNLNEKNEMDAFEVEEEATKEFKGEIYNSNRPILQWEKEIQNRKRDEMLKMVRMMNRGRDAEIKNQISK